MVSQRKRKSGINDRAIWRRRHLFDEEMREWDQMPPVGREFGSPDFERLMAEDQRVSAHYVSLAETRALLGSSLAARKARLAAADMISTDEAAEILKTSRAIVNARIAMGRCIGMRTKRGFRLPRWQFDPWLWPLLPKLAAALATTEGWALLAFLEAPHGALGGMTPRAAIEQGQGERVLDIAKAS